MSLAAGSKLGPYEIVAPLGAGGMGEVYRARDTKLKRDVALKVLPESFAEDPERMARFQREAEVLASLNHTNIAQIYGVEGRALVMELVEGESPSGPMAFEDAWKIAAQIAAGLEYAHERGIVHRDLKPANIKVTPDGVVKLLDFGLAKAFTGPAAVSGSLDNSPTLTLGATQVGVILGTAAYMAPEQAKGKSVDKRADVWSFGVVLYELLTGERLFTGEDVSDTLAHVLTRQPDLEKVPAPARRLLRECLEKDPKQRLRDIGDAKRQLVAEAPVFAELAASTAPSRSRLQKITATAAAVLGVALAGLAWVHFREAAPAAELMRFQIEAPEKMVFAAAPPMVSPDGRKLAFIVSENGVNRLWVWSLDTLDARPLTGTDGVGTNVYAWSPDSRSIAYANTNRLRKVDVSGGPPQTVCDFPAADRGIAWGSGGEIIFGTAAGGLLRVSEAGGAPAPLTKADIARGETIHSRPSFLPDGRHFFYFRHGNPEVQGIYLGSMDVSPDQQSKKRLLVADGIARYAPSADGRSGYVLFLREGTLMAQPFDAKRLELAGSAFPIAESVGTTFQNSWFSVSANGVLAYRTGLGETTGGLQLTWFDRSGKSLGAASEPGAFGEVTLSPDGTRAAATRQIASNTDVWLYEFAHGNATRLTFDPANDRFAAWSPDGKRIAFTSGRTGVGDLYQKPSDGAGEEATLFQSKDQKTLSDWSRDGRFLMYSQQGKGGIDLWSVALEGEKKPVAYVQSGFIAAEGRFSPDTRFVAYSSNATGMPEIYVHPFPNASGGQWMVSKGGGSHPRWRRDGKELFYISSGSQLMAVDVSLSPTFKAGIPKALFVAPISNGAGGAGSTRYDVSADGKRFLINSLAVEANTGGKAPPITVVLNWQAGLRK